MNMDLIEILRVLVIHFLPFLFALSFHEFAHAWVAQKRGDQTAALQGRLTLNPLVHADPTGTFVLPLMGLFFGLPVFGWAKPVPVNPHFLKSPKNDMFWVAFAGPLSNFLLAFLGALAYAALLRFPELAQVNSYKEFLYAFVLINVLLAIFNLIPLHPLDGGKVLGRFLPEKVNRFLEDNEHHSSILLIAFFVLGGFKYLSLPVLTVMGWIGGVAEKIISVF